MTALEFVKSCVEIGYCDTKNAKKYVDMNQKELYDDDDYLNAHRMVANIMGGYQIGGKYTSCGCGKITKRYKGLR